MDMDMDMGRDAGPPLPGGPEAVRPAERRQATGAARVVSGCAAAAVFGFAALVVLFGFVCTIEMESFPGLRDNLAPLAVYALAFAVLLTVGGLALAGRRSYGGWAAVAVLGVLMALRMWTLAPMLHCWSYDSVGRDDDGSYSCVNRGDMLP
ncbi:hypothetical protein [Streptomyces colonosanans]|uniref:Uncharacterized protein n=1 Tax=Streptomyces colonosanans TaxID=1428652 RepID=A0A1S2PDD0_9ACTN|nr:hypothetical protein [Streptomyces colonosanans]OIJ90944.1 hypothetical protein BIV24_17355 [Streptomyces colonosanans]